MVTFQPRQASGIRSGQRRNWLPPPKQAKILLQNDEAREVVQFIPEGESVTLVKFPMSLTGCWSEHVSSGRHTLPIEMGRKVYAKLVKAGFVEG